MERELFRATQLVWRGRVDLGQSIFAKQLAQSMRTWLLYATHHKRKETSQRIHRRTNQLAESRRHVVLIALSSALVWEPAMTDRNRLSFAVWFSSLTELPLYPACASWMDVVAQRCGHALRALPKRGLHHVGSPVFCPSLTVHFWAPTAKWFITAANIADINRPVEKLSVPQQTGAFAYRIG